MEKGGQTPQARPLKTDSFKRLMKCKQYRKKESQLDFGI
jgi:hypothetical protein